MVTVLFGISIIGLFFATFITVVFGIMLIVQFFKKDQVKEKIRKYQKVIIISILLNIIFSVICDFCIDSFPALTFIFYFVWFIIYVIYYNIFKIRHKQTKDEELKRFAKRKKFLIVSSSIMIALTISFGVTVANSDVSETVIAENEQKQKEKAEEKKKREKQEKQKKKSSDNKTKKKSSTKKKETKKKSSEPKLVSELSKTMEKSVAEKAYDILINQIGLPKSLKFGEKDENLTNYTLWIDDINYVMMTASDDVYRVWIPNSDNVFYENDTVLKTYADYQSTTVTMSDESYMGAIAEGIVDSCLNNPSGVHFSADKSFKKNGSMYIVQGEVTGRNSFNAKVTETYTVEFKSDDITSFEYELIYLKLGSESVGSYIDF